MIQTLFGDHDRVKIRIMTKIDDIKNAISELAPKEFSLFRNWLEQFEAARFDGQIEDDVAAGKLDKLAENAFNDYREGRFTEL